MKINLSKPIVRKNSRRTGVALAFICLTCLGLSQNPAELKDRKRITSLQIGEAAEGSRVTIVSDSTLNDYEAFRRGDRFYVRIPLADFAAARPSFQGDGFEDVQVQIVGNSTVISFKLQPGASARVDQRANRLDVIFSSAARIARTNSASAVRTRVVSASNGSRNTAGSTQRRASDVAGPVPPDSPTYGARVVSESTDENRFADTQTSISRQAPSGRSAESNKFSSQQGPAQGTATPGLSVPPSTTSTYPPLTSATPLNTVSSTTNRPAPTATSTWKARTDTAFQWAKANSLVTALASLALLGAIVFLAVVMLRRRKGVVRTKRANAPKVQPRYSQDPDLEDMLADGLRSDTSENSFDTFVDGSAEWDSEATFTSSPAATVHIEQELRERIGRLTEPSLPPLEVGARKEQMWGSAESAARYSGTHKNLEHEREVIEL